MGEDQRELAHAVGGERRKVEVLDDEDAVVDVQRLRHLERPAGVLGRDRAVAQGVAAGDGDAAFGEYARELEARSGLAREVRVGVVPVLAPAGVKEDGVARLELEVAEVVGRERLSRVRAREIDEVAARDDLGDRLGAEHGHACG